MAVSLEEEKKLLPDVLRQLVLGQLTEPVVFHGLLQWPLLSWTWADWAQRMGDSRLPFRKGRRGVTKGPQWEWQCSTVHLTLREFGRAATEQDGDSWLYYDYKHMAELMREHPDVVEAVSWASLGFPEKTGSDSTLWIGSTGAHTPCHADTYGCNLVAQIMGRKQWILFPPDTLSILPTRVPYEESSIYSQRNFYSPDPSMADELLGARVVTLGPGDVLFVPRRWWHYVENLSPAISINVWLPLEDLDDEARLEEALVRFIVTQLCKDLPAAVHSSLLNPNEEDVADTPLSVTLSQLRLCLDKCSDAGGCSKLKKAKLQRAPCDATSVHGSFMQVVQPMPPAMLKGLLQDKITALQGHLAADLTVRSCAESELSRKLIDAFCQPDIIALVRKNLLHDT